MTESPDIKPPRKKRKGKYVASDDGRAVVARLAAAGIKRGLIARVLGVSEKTVQRHYANELEMGDTLAIADVAQTAYEMAVSGKYPVMTIFYLKTRAQWRETTRVELTGEDGGPLTVMELAARARSGRVIDGTAVEVGQPRLNGKNHA